MEGRYIVEENINFESFLKVMGVTDEAKIEEMIKATKGDLHDIIKYSLTPNPLIIQHNNFGIWNVVFCPTLSGYKEVSLTDHGDGTWTQVSGLKTSTFPINQEYKVVIKVVIITFGLLSGLLGRQRVDWLCDDGGKHNEEIVQGEGDTFLKYNWNFIE